MCLTIRISESGRRKLGLTIAALNGMLSLTGLALIGLGAYMNIHLESKMALMEGYDSGTLPYFLITIGLLMFVLDGLFAKVGYDTAFPESRATFQNLLIMFILMKFVLMWVILAGSIMSFTHQEVIRQSFKNGLTAVLKRYKTDKSAKFMMDKVQMSYKCCGSNTYLDWLTTNWINEEFLNTKSLEVKRKIRNGLYYSDDVPFSCCNPEVQRPCVHHDIRNRSAHINYGAITLYKKGCAAKLMFYIEYIILTPTAYTVLSAFFIQMVTCILLRYLQSSILNACLMERPLGPGAGYVIPECPCDLCKTGDPMKYVNEGRYEDDAGTEAKGEIGGELSNLGGGGGGGGGVNWSNGGGDGFEGRGGESHFGESSGTTDKGKRDKGEKQGGEKQKGSVKAEKESKKGEKEGNSRTKDGGSKNKKGKNDKATNSPAKAKKPTSPAKQKQKAQAASSPAKTKPKAPSSPKAKQRTSPKSPKSLKSPKTVKTPKSAKKKSPKKR